MKKTILLLAGFLFLTSAAWSDEIELGFGVAPAIGAASGANTDENVQDNSLKVLRAAWTTLGIFNISLDSIILPPSSIQQMTSTVNWETGTVIEGFYRPGMVNMVDLGVKLQLFGLVAGAQVGVNSLYIYRMNEDADLFKSLNTDLGANIKVSFGYKFAGMFGVEATMYSIQPNIETAVGVLRGLAAENPAIQEQASTQLLSNAAIALLLVMYL